MTTTLRPTEDPRTLPNAGRTRHYAVCVNGTPVGGIRFSARGPAGTISELEIHENARRRGRGTIALLAGEEILRSWGCARAEADVPSGPAEADALRLAAELGYTVRARQMAKHLTAPAPELPQGLTARPMNPAEFSTWSARNRRGYAEDLHASGIPQSEAVTQAQRSFEAFLPQGADTPRTLLRSLDADGTPVGTLWVRLDHTTHPDGRRLAWVLDIEVAEEHRGRGLGRALMLLAERECLAAGGHDLGLNVFAGNTPANALYRSLGFLTYNTSLLKPL